MLLPGLMLGIFEGFGVGFNSYQLKRSHRSLAGAYSHPHMVTLYLKKQISLSTVVGPFPKHTVPNYQIWSNAKDINQSHEYTVQPEQGHPLFS